jgi:hypothetical protein
MVLEIYQCERFTRSVLQAKLIDRLEADEIPEEFDGDFIQVQEEYIDE